MIAIQFVNFLKNSVLLVLIGWILLQPVANWTWNLSVSPFMLEVGAVTFLNIQIRFKMLVIFSILALNKDSIWIF